jgi:Kdo2-lipid IVA lauroyltransferase/acyltransferase
MRRYHRGLAQLLPEVIKAARMPAAEIRRRVRIVNLEAPRARLSRGESVLLVAARQCNWEWMLLALSLELGYPVDAGPGRRTGAGS